MGKTGGKLAGSDRQATFVAGVIAAVAGSRWPYSIIGICVCVGTFGRHWIVGIKL